MSVQNGERLATKQDLADMYSGILPYLGGMPEVLANKFSKGDLYDTTEKMIGKWIDNKPLYQRVWTGLNVIPNYNQWVDTTAQIPKTCEIKMARAISGTATNSDFSSNFNISVNPYDTDNNVLKVLNTWSFDNRTITGFIVYYTKTTDSANSFNIGEATDYSTTEKIIGTWLNGEPLWQVTITGILSTTNKRAEIVTLSTIGIDKDYLWGYHGILINPSSHGSMNMDNSQCQIWNDNGVLKWANDSEVSGRTYYITLQYTKPTS